VSALLFALAAWVALSAAGLAWAQARRAASATSSDLRGLAIALKSVAAAERLSELARRASPASWEGELATEALASPDERRVAVVNLALSEIDHVLTRGDGWPRAAVRIALLGGALLAFTAFLLGYPIVWSIAIMGMGGVSAMVCIEAGNRARRIVAAQREAIDLLISTVFGELAAGSGPREPSRRRRAR